LLTVHYDQGDALKGERIYAEARTIDKHRQIQEGRGSQTKVSLSTTLRRSAYCMIEKPLRANKIA